MKKILFTVLIVMAALCFASAAFAANATWSGASTAISDSGAGPGISASDINLSPNVQYYYTGTDEAYAIATRNTSGTKTYGIGSTVGNIFMADATTDATKPGSASEDYSDSDVWTQVIR